MIIISLHTTAKRTKQNESHIAGINIITLQKSKRDSIGKTILDGAYYAALSRITSSTNPNLFVMRYHENSVEDLTVVPKYFFTPDILEDTPSVSTNS